LKDNDFIMTNDTSKTTHINFAHGNGFPSGSYQTFFNYFPDNINVIALDKYGHDNALPVNNNWQGQVDELIAFVKENQPVNSKGEREKTICLGHSFGGVISFIACCQEPSLFKGLVMLDPPVLTGAPALAAKLLKKTRWIDKFSPAGKAKVRRTHWPLGTDIGKLFSERKLFKSFDSRCLDDYIKHGIIERNERLELLFDAQIEAEVFRNLPSNLTSYKNKLTIPATLIYGESTDVFPHRFFKRFTRLNKNITLKTTPGGHMFPLERPEDIAKMVTDIINKF
jgi:pimeloyl-ACP methyl ester carboxylesterase